MSEEILTGASPKATELLIEDWTGFTNASDILDGLTPAQAVNKRPDWPWPYSVAEQVAHMLFWQEHTLTTIKTGTEPEVPTAAVSWPAVTEADWPRVKDEFLAGLERSREVARDSETLNRVLGSNYTVGVKLLSQITHDSYHLGQVVLLRRMMGAWPPSGGGNTW